MCSGFRHRLALTFLLFLVNAGAARSKKPVKSRDCADTQALGHEQRFSTDAAFNKSA